MFDKNYKNAMDSVKPDEQTYDKILEKIILKEEIKSRKNPATVWRVAFACVACVAIVLGVIFVPRDRFNPTVKSDLTTPQTLKVSKSYDEIYKLIKPKKTALYNYITDEEYIVEEEITYAEGTATNSANNSGAVKPGGSKGENTSASLSDDNADSENDYSTTTEQVEGVTEADIVKTDGEYIYYVNDKTLSIFKADGENTRLVSKTKLSHAENYNLYGEMFLKDDRLVLLKTNYYAPVATNVLVDYNYNDYKETVLIEIYDISDKTSPKKLAESCQDGMYNSSRMVGDYIYLISNCHINTATIDKDDPTTFVPTTQINGVCEPVPADSIYRYEQEQYNTQYTVVGAFNYKDGNLNDTVSLLGGTDNIYCSQGNIILADTSYSQKEEKDDATIISQEITTVSRLTIKNGEIEYKTSGEVEGTLENQFFIDEHNGYFRFVTTVTKSVEKKHKFDNSEHEVVSYSSETFAKLTILDSELKKTGEITDIAKGERVYSARFMGDTAYFVTFRQTDPLFSADLSDPKNPKILGELKIPGFSEYMYPYGDGLLLGFGMEADENTGRTTDLKLSMFNIGDPANVTEQDKTIVKGYEYSTALSNHKAMLVDPQKNLIGFAATYDYYQIKYMIYKYTGSGFERVAAIDIETDYKYYAMDDIRGLFVGDYFYVVSKDALQIFDMNEYRQILTIK